MVSFRSLLFFLLSPFLFLSSFYIGFPSPLPPPLGCLFIWCLVLLHPSHHSIGVPEVGAVIVLYSSTFKLFGIFRCRHALISFPSPLFSCFSLSCYCPLPALLSVSSSFSSWLVVLMLIPPPPVLVFFLFSFGVCLYSMGSAAIPWRPNSWYVPPVLIHAGPLLAVLMRLPSICIIYSLVGGWR